jgi:hypothetical protein
MSYILEDLNLYRIFKLLPSSLYVKIVIRKEKNVMMVETKKLLEQWHLWI